MSAIPPEEITADLIASVPHMDDMTEHDARLLLTAIWATSDTEWLAV